MGVSAIRLSACPFANNCDATDYFLTSDYGTKQEAGARSQKWDLNPITLRWEAGILTTRLKPTPEAGFGPGDDEVRFWFRTC